jgi:futalosine hydrolase
MEIAPLVATSRGSSRHALDILATGVGMVPTAARCSSALARTPYDLALNFGLCGSFDPKLAPGTVVHVVADRLPEMGAEDGDMFLTIQQLNLLDDDAFPFRGGELVNTAAPLNAALGALPTVRGITVNTVHGAERSIAEVTGRFHPDVESMEGAAFMYACLINDIPFAQVRAVSNVVERRNRESWRVADAIENLGNTARSILETL